MRLDCFLASVAKLQPQELQQGGHWFDFVALMLVTNSFDLTPSRRSSLDLLSDE